MSVYLSNQSVRIEYATPDFFKLPVAKIEMQRLEYTGRVYFLFRGQIVAVAKPARAQ